MDAWKPRHWVNLSLGVLASLGAIWTIVAFARARLGYAAGFWSPNQEARLVVVALWAVLPPVCFFIEYFLLTDRQDRPAVRQDQDVAAKIWAGVLAYAFVMWT